jgi:hypothetical protein
VKEGRKEERSRKVGGLKTDGRKEYRKEGEEGTCPTPTWVCFAREGHHHHPTKEGRTKGTPKEGH